MAQPVWAHGILDSIITKPLTAPVCCLSNAWINKKSEYSSTQKLQFYPTLVLQLCSCVFILELKILQMLGRRKCCLIFWILVDNSSSFFQGWIFVAMALIFGLLAKFCSCFWNIICCKPCKEAEANQVWKKKKKCESISFSNFYDLIFIQKSHLYLIWKTLT